jgi:tRNA pseudouridine38-40 synthase
MLPWRASSWSEPVGGHRRSTLVTPSPDPVSTAPSGAPSPRPDTPASPAGQARVRLTVAYDGSAFHGFAANEGLATVQGRLSEALSLVLRADVTVTGAGRTDAGVHAWGQVVSFDAPANGLDLDRLARRVNGLCGPAISVREAEVVADDFDARFSARWRRYRYTVLTMPWPDPFRAGTAWHVGKPLRLSDLRLACDPLVGEHDFASFCRRPKPAPGAPVPSLVRRVLDAHWDDLGDGGLRFEITGTSFCHQMVRSVVGTLVEVGLGRRRAGEVLAILRARDRSAAGPVAPAHGLCLWEVGY